MAANTEDLFGLTPEDLEGSSASALEEEKKKEKHESAVQKIFSDYEPDPSPLFPTSTADSEPQTLEPEEEGNISAEVKKDESSEEIQNIEDTETEKNETPEKISDSKPRSCTDVENLEQEDPGFLSEVEDSESALEKDEASEEISNTKIALAVVAGSFLIAGTVALFVFCPPAAAAAVFVGAKIGAATGLTAAAHAAIPLVVAAAKVAGSAIVGAAATAGGAITGAAATVGGTLTGAAATAGGAITHAAGLVAHAAIPVAHVAKAAGDALAQTASTAMQSTVGRLALTVTAGIVATKAIKGAGSLLSTAAKKIQDLGSSKDTGSQKSQERETATIPSSISTPTATN